MFGRSRRGHPIMQKTQPMRSEGQHLRVRPIILMCMSVWTCAPLLARMGLGMFLRARAGARAGVRVCVLAFVSACVRVYRHV